MQVEGILHVWQARHAKIDELQPRSLVVARWLDDNIVRLDIAVNDAYPVQRGGGLGEL
jgi:hypothetical protein